MTAERPVSVCKTSTTALPAYPKTPKRRRRGVTVWENAVATKKLPGDLFKGEMDAWWKVSPGEQTLAFIGERRRSLEVDDRSR
jgi:hypothetical protein